jgi:ABC-type amino acid transport system permease subunit
VRIGLPLALPTAAVVLGITRGWHFVLPQWGWVEIVVLTVIVVAIAPVVASYRRVRSVGDRTGKPVKQRRVQWALGWSLATAPILTFTGAATVQDLAPLWAALAGT